MHAYEVRPRKDHRGVDLTSDTPRFRIAPESFVSAKGQMMRPPDATPTTAAYLR